MQNLFRTSLLPICAALTLALSVPMADAGPRAGGGGSAKAAPRPASGGGAKAANHSGGGNRAAATRPAGGGNNKVNAGNTVNRGSNNNVKVDNSQRNVNVDNNRNVNVNVNGNGCGGCNNGWYDDDDWNVGRAVVTTAAVVGTAAVIGSIVSSVPPSCVQTNINGIIYQQCGNTWYQPQYVGSTVNYVVVNPPR